MVSTGKVLSAMIASSLALAVSAGPPNTKAVRMRMKTMAGSHFFICLLVGTVADFIADLSECKGPLDSELIIVVSRLVYEPDLGLQRTARNNIEADSRNGFAQVLGPQGCKIGVFFVNRDSFKSSIR